MATFTATALPWSSTLHTPTTLRHRIPLRLASFSHQPITKTPRPALATRSWGISARGAGYVFGPDIADQFLYANQLELIARSHQLAMEGYKYFFGQLLVTVWSAPNYCYRCGNVAAILTINVESVIDFSVFEPRPKDLRETPDFSTRTPDYFL